MSESPSKESDIPPLSHIGSSVEHHGSKMDSACNVCQNRLGSIPWRDGFLTAALPESLLQGTSIDLQSALTLTLFWSILFLGIWNWWHVWCQEKQSSGVLDLIRKSWSEGTAKQWAPILRRWFKFCSENGLQPLNADVSSGAEFLTQYFRKSSCEYSSVNTARSALSSILTVVNGFTFGEQPPIKHLL